MINDEEKIEIRLKKWIKIAQEFHCVHRVEVMFFL